MSSAKRPYQSDFWAPKISPESRDRVAKLNEKYKNFPAQSKKSQSMEDMRFLNYLRNLNKK